MKRRTLIYAVLALVIFALAATVGFAIARDEQPDPHSVDRITEHHSVGPATPLAIVLYSIEHGGADGHRVTKLRIHHHVRPATRAGSNWRKDWHVWVEGDNGLTGAMQVRGDVRGSLSYHTPSDQILGYDQSEGASVGAIVWDVDAPVPWDVVKSHGINASGVPYVYRRVYFKFHADYTVAGVGVHKTILPWVSITARGNGTFAFDKGGL